jgi:hypothetical protein
MVSFDVESLFTNIPVLETIDLVIARAFSSSERFCNFDRKRFRKLLNTTLRKSHFQYKDLFFDQIDGVAMGSPLAPTMAAFFMDAFENKHMINLEKLGVKGWFRYVDDVFALVEEGKDLDKIKDYLNSQHNNLRFTSEQEKSGKLAFLDLSIKKSDGKFYTTIYRKPTFTGVYLNWLSLTDNQYKIGLINCLLDRAWKICTTYELFQEEANNIKTILRQNEYPNRVLDMVMKKFVAKRKKGVEEVGIPTVEKKKIFLVLPYQNRRMDEYKKRLTSLVNRFYPQIDFRLMFTCPYTIGQMFPFKERTPPGLVSRVVYKIKCKDCSEFYIGKTMRCICRRIAEHKQGSGTEEYRSSIFKHAQSHKHEIDYDGMEMIDRADTDRKLLLKEMLYIQKYKPQINVQKRSSLFSLIIGRTNG